MIKPIPVVVDGNLYLNALSASLLGTMDPKDLIYQNTKPDVMLRGRGMVIKSFIVTFFKTIEDIRKKGYDVTNVCIVWDRKLKGKYKKTLLLDALNDGQTYKSDRKFASEEDLNNPDLTDTELKVLRAKLIQNTEFLEARKFLQEELPKYGIPNISSPGWEADDLDYIWGLETNKLGGTHIHCSGDSDWQYHLTNDDILWQPSRGGKVYVKDVESVREKKKIPEGYGLMEWAAIEYATLGSHNNLLRTVKPEIKRFTKKWRDKLYVDKDYSAVIGDMPRFTAQKKTFDILSFTGVDNIKELYKEMLSMNPTSDPTEFLSLLNKVGVNSRDKSILKNKYSAYKSALLNSRLKQL